MVSEDAKAVVGALAQPALLLDGDGYVLYANMPAQLRFGITEGEKCSRFFQNQQGWCSGCPLSLLRTEAGRVRMCRFYSQNMRFGMRLTSLEGGVILGMLAEAHTETEPQRYKFSPHLLDAVNDIVLIVGQDRRITHVNHAFTRRLGIPSQAVLGRDYREIWPQSLSLDWDALEEKILRAGETVTLRDIEYSATLSGETLVLDATFIPYQENKDGFQGIIGIIHSTSEEKRLAKKLAEAERRYTELFEMLPFGVVVVGRDRRARLINSTAQNFLGSGIDLKTRPFEEIIAPEDRTRILVDFRRALEEGQPRPDGNDFWIRHASGQRRRLFVRACVFDYMGERCLLVACIDITSLQPGEEHILHLTPFTGVGALVTSVVHEFNNVLAAVHGRAELILNNADTSIPLITDCAQAIIRHCRRASRIVDQVHSVAAIQVARPAAVRWEDILEDILASLSLRFAEENIRVERSYKATHAVWADPGHLHQLVLNLLQNARDAMRPHSGGTIRIGTRDVHDGVALDVEDTGTGMDETTQKRIFEPFFSHTDESTQKRRAGLGLGLGLTIVHQIVQANNGRIEIASHPGKGTRFTVVFPQKCEEEEGSRPVSTEPVPPMPRSLRVVVVDDDADVTEMITLALSTRGYKSFVVNDGLRAVERCVAIEADVLLIDRNLHPLDGLDVIRELRRRGIRTPAVLLTGRQGEEDNDMLRQLGIFRSLVKPASLAELFAAIESACEASSVTDDHGRC